MHPSIHETEIYSGEQADRMAQWNSGKVLRRSARHLVGLCLCKLDAATHQFIRQFSKTDKHNARTRHGNGEHRQITRITSVIRTEFSYSGYLFFYISWSNEWIYSGLSYIRWKVALKYATTLHIHIFPYKKNVFSFCENR